MDDQHSSYQRQGHCSQSQGLNDIDGVYQRQSHRSQSQGLNDIDGAYGRQGHRSQSQGLHDIDGDHGTSGTIRALPRAKWSHDMKLFLIELLKDHDVPGFRTHNAWSKEAWTNIVCRLNNKYGVSFSINQVKQKEQDLKKDYRSVKELVAESGFGWDNGRKMVDASDNIWNSFAARKKSKEALQWRGKSFPYFEQLSSLYDGRYAEGRTRHGMDYYANKAIHASMPPSQVEVSDSYQSPSPTIHGVGESGLPSGFEEEGEDFTLDPTQHPSTPMESTPMQHMQTTPNCRQVCQDKPARREKRQKRKHIEPADGFHERYLKFKKEEIERFAIIEEKKLEDPYSINKCITALEELNDLQLGDMLMASNIFQKKENREVFLSFSANALRLAWIRREIERSQSD